MLKKRITLLTCVALILALMVGTFSPVFASGEYTFDAKLAEEEWAKAASKPLSLDKTLEDGKGIGLYATGTYPTRKGVILVTPDKYKGLIPTGHAAIIYNSTTVVESLSGGVVTGKNDWNKARSKCYGVTVKSTTSSQDSNAANWCHKQRGKSYNWNYLNVSTRNSFYCSHLIWAAYKDLYNINLNTSAYGAAVHPMELVNTSLTTKIYEK